MREGRKEGRSQTKSLELEAVPLYLEEVSGEPGAFFTQRIPLCFALAQAIATVSGSKPDCGGRSLCGRERGVEGRRRRGEERGGEEERTKDGEAASGGEPRAAQIRYRTERAQA